jgi:hypothetical protein
MSPDVFPHGETHSVPVMASQAVWPRVTANKSASYGTFFVASFFSCRKAIIEEFSKANERGSVPSHGQSDRAEEKVRAKEWTGGWIERVGAFNRDNQTPNSLRFHTANSRGNEISRMKSC